MSRNPFTLLWDEDGRPVVLRFGLVLSAHRSPAEQAAAHEIGVKAQPAGPHLHAWRALAARPAPDELDERADELAAADAARRTWHR